LTFNSYVFAAFFVVVLAVYNLPTLEWRGQKTWLLITSYVFYAAWDPVFIVLVWLSTVVDWFSARLIHDAPSRARKRALLVGSLIVNLGVLGYFKYGNFLLANLVAGLHALGVDYQPAPFDIILPIGISFYTFHSLSYTLDVYLGRTTPDDSLLDFALYVSFFPALVAGPILRSAQFLPQCKTPRRSTGPLLGWGLALMVLGLFEKQVLADGALAPAADKLFTLSGTTGSVDAWIGTLAFAGQIFFDFAGYSTCAIGVALCLGFSMPDNFRFPYAAVGFSDFWTRWHISLSSWLRDYLYIPLGGNRIGPARTYVNLMLTMLIGGLWHGASWTFVVWGGLHGAYLVGERAIRRVAPKRTGTAGRLAAMLVTFVLVTFAWVFFRARSFDQAFAIAKGLAFVTNAKRVINIGDVRVVAFISAGLLAVHFAMRERRLEDVFARTHWLVRSLGIAAMLVAIVIMQGEDRAFIYFQF
jgi:alginate O-acetyltransferase complex protein AlgI